MRSFSLVLAALLVACALVAFGCGSDDDDGNGGSSAGGGGSAYGGGKSDDGGAKASNGGGNRLTLAADPSGALKFDKTSLTTKPGTVTIAFDNPSDVPHAVEVEGKGVEEESDTVTNGNTKVTVDLEPGEYVFYCPVGDHEQAGMKGTLTVR